ncbi:MAG: hypothetical protein JRI31_00920 [Deltaproteobacteria bacterium]|nr:hypothetical protein [Deltaproteobacteria bacterium]
MIRRRPDNFELWIDDFFMKLVEKLESSPHLIHQLMDSVSKRRCILLEKAIDILFKEELILSRKREVAR